MRKHGQPLWVVRARACSLARPPPPPMQCCLAECGAHDNRWRACACGRISSYLCQLAGPSASVCGWFVMARRGGSSEGRGRQKYRSRSRRRRAPGGGRTGFVIMQLTRVAHSGAQADARRVKSRKQLTHGRRVATSGARDDCLGGARVPPAEQVESSAVWAVLSGGGRGRKEPSGADYGAERASLMSVSRFDGSASSERPTDRPTWALAKVARKGGQWRSRAEAAKNGDELGRLVACARVRR